MSTERLTRALADRYRIERELGQGGMATVYLAYDLRHEREVAIKVLHPDLGAALGGDRFLSEIKTTARLQHPHILPLLESGAADGLLYYVMPYVRGETLRTRLERERQLPLEDALRIAREVADALGAAHAIGIIHRDIKPENILLQGGHALVADFGIALAVQHAGGARMTQTGLSLGTPQYMSPEQAMGERAIDARTDIYALGAVTYEMLAGDPPFTGSSVQAIVARVLSERPTPLHTLRDTIPPGVEQAVLTALAKLPADRFATAEEFSRALSPERFSTVGRSAVAPRGEPASAGGHRNTLVFGGITVAAIAAAVWGWTRSAPSTDAAVTRLEFTTVGDLRFAYPVLGTVTALALSPDGSRAVFAATQPGGWALAIRNLDQLTARILPGTEGATYPEFSPDGRWIAFVAPDGDLKKIAADGSSLAIICPVGIGNSAGITWLSNDVIVFAPNSISSSPGLMRVSAGGGRPSVLSRIDSASGERFQLAPRSAEGGRLVFYSSTRASNLDLQIGVVNTETGKVTLTGVRGAAALGVVEKTLVFVRGDGALMAAPFDVKTLEAGAPIQVGDSMAVRNWLAPASISRSGALLYQQGGSAGQLVWVDHTGGMVPVVDVVRNYAHPRFSLDGRKLAFEVVGAGGGDIWTYEIGSKTLERLTSGGGRDRPEWSPDGTRVMYSSSQDEPQGLWWQPANGSAAATKLHAGAAPIREGVFTPDSRSLVYRTDSPETNRDIWMVPLTGTRTPVALLTGLNDDKEPRVSPNSQWLAYVSNESGREEVYVRPLSPEGGRVAVSSGGGGEPLWAPDGRRLYYRSDDKVMEATIITTPSLSVTGRRVLFSGPYASDIYHANYDVAPDGRRFVMVRPVQEARRLVMVVNWVQELRARMGTVKE